MLLRSVLAAPEAADRSRFKTLQSLPLVTWHSPRNLIPWTTAPPSLRGISLSQPLPKRDTRLLLWLAAFLQKIFPWETSSTFNYSHRFQIFGAGSKPFPQPLTHPEKHLRDIFTYMSLGSSNVTCPKWSWPPLPSAKRFNNCYTSSTQGR